MKSGIIKKEFIDWLRLNHSIIDFNFESIDLKGGKNETIPKELTHDYLLRNFKIDEVIYKYYHLPTIKLISDGEFQRMKEGGFIGKKETALKPYSIKIFGAYHSRSDLTWKLTTVCNSKYTIKGNKIKYFIDLIPYFKEYAKGFEKGFNEFENTQIKPYFPMFAEKQDYVNKIFEFITKRLFINHNWASRNGFTINQEYEIVNAFDDGQHQGYFYRAWSTVFSNNNLFAPLFQEHLKALPPQPIKTKTDIFKEKIQSMGFFNLPKVQELTINGQNKLIGLITDNMAYGIAMFNYLGFCEFLDKENGGVKKTTNIALSKLYNEKAKDDSQARHYRNSLIKPKERYTSYLHKETVKNDYEQLK